MNRRFAAALFDLDDTLHDDTAAYRAAADAAARDGAHRSGADRSELYRAYVARVERFWHGLSPEALTVPLVAVRETMWTQALADVGVVDAQLGTLLAERYNAYRGSALVLWPGVADMLARLRAGGLKLAIVTNGFAETHRDKIVRLGLERAVDVVIMADDVGTVKPDPLFFTHAADRLGVRANACAVVGDRYERDVCGAHAAGMFAVWLDVRADALPPGARAPDAVCTRITQVEPILLQRAGPAA